MPTVTRVSAALGFACLVFAGLASAQAYPTKAIRFIVPFPPGGPVDTVARVVGQPVTVENRAGAGGVLGAEAAAKSPGDGYTVFVCAIHHSVAPSIQPRLPYDFWRDFVPVSMGTTFPIIVVANPSVPVGSLRELAAYAKANPGKLSYGSAGNGGGTHLAGELFKALSGTDILHVPYKGSAPAMTDVLGGQVQLMFADGPTALPQIKGGKVKALGVAQAARSALAPDIPSATENGMPGYDAYSWAAFVAPTGTPAAADARLNAEIVKALSSPDSREALLSRGAEPQPGTPEQFATFMRAEMAKWAKVVKDAGIKAD